MADKKEEAVNKLKSLKTAVIRADKLKEISPDLHHCIGMMSIYGDDDLLNDVYSDSPEEMEVKFTFEENEFRAEVIKSGLEFEGEPYEYLWVQADDKAFFDFVELITKERR